MAKHRRHGCAFVDDEAAVGDGETSEEDEGDDEGERLNESELG